MIYMIFTALSIAAIINIVFGAIFSFKLKKILIKGPHNKELNQETVFLIGKSCILTVVGTVSTICSFVLWCSHFDYNDAVSDRFSCFFSNCVIIADILDMLS